MFSYGIINYYFILCSVYFIRLANPQDYFKKPSFFSAYTPNNRIAADFGQKVQLQLFYESLCPDCINFDPEFVKVALTLRPHVDVRTYPYGNAKMNKRPDGSVAVACQHGQKECYGNKLHACAIDVLGGVMPSLQYNSCMIGNMSDDAAADMCGKQLRVPVGSVEEIKACAKSLRGHQLLVQYGKESLPVGYTHVPYVLIDGNEWTGGDFMGAVCAAFVSTPWICRQMGY